MSAAKNIVLGVTGSIAAYKAAELASQLTHKDCDVHVVLTADALRFITAVSFKVLSRNPVVTDLYDDDGWKPAHIKLADEANLLLIAPATANTIAKLTLGLANDALSCVALAGDERKDVAAPGNAGERGEAQIEGRGVHRAGGRAVVVRLRGSGPAMADR
jgi:phosphopantothenoylcysteine synthetase/decarboxylase